MNAVVLSKASLPIERRIPSKRTEKSDAGISRELIKAIAEEIGRGTVAYVEVMYPEAIKATSSTFKLSLRNHIHNAIVSIAELHDEPAMRARLQKDADFRKRWVAMYRKMRRTRP